MPLLAGLRSLASKFFRGSRTALEMDEELRSHIQQRAEDLERSGLDPANAARRARIEFGGYERYRQETHEAIGGNFFETLLQDTRFSFRVLLKSPGFTLTAVVTLALAIGANAVVFGVLNALVLRPLNLPHTESLFGVEHGDDFGFQSYANYRDLRDRTHSFDGLAAVAITQEALDTGNNPTTDWAYETTGNYFDVLEQQPYLGRFFHASDEHGPNSAPYIVLSYPYWHTRFSDDRNAVGRVVQINKHPFTILGVAQPDFRGTLLFFTPDFFLPIVDQPQVDGWNGLDDRGNRWMFEIMGHLKPGVSGAEAVADLNSVGAWLEKTYPKVEGHKKYSLERPGLYGSFLGRPIKGFVAGLTLLAGLILLAACANLGSLFAARAADRSREVALRLALGSSRNRILRQLMTEATLVSIFGGGLGLAGSVLLLQRLAGWRPFGRFPINVPVTPDAKVYMIALGLAVVSGFLFGMVPVRQVLRANPYEIVKAGSSGAVGRRLTLRDVLLVIQIALCAVLVTSSLVAIRGLMRSLNSDYGFEPRGAMVAVLHMTSAGYVNDDVPPMQKRIIDAMESIPGVQAAATINTPPLSLGGDRRNVYRDETRDLRASNSAGLVYMYIISPHYFDAARTARFAGRAFTEHDTLTTPRVAIVNREFARRILSSDREGVGRSYRMEDGTRVQVVGVVDDGKYQSLTENPQPAMFLPVLQMQWSQTSLIVRFNRDPTRVAAAIRTKLRELDPSLPAEISSWNQILDGVLFPSRVATVALGILGLMGAMLSVTGIFGMAAYSVSKRLRELGIRMALGAQRRELLSAALGRALKLLAIGSAAGLVLGILAARVLAYIVYQASARDPVVLAGVVAAMAVLGLVATWLPAQRALSIDPLQLLREE
jgi:predicted permease